MSVQVKRINKKVGAKKNSVRNIYEKDDKPIAADGRMSNSKDTVQRWVEFSTNPQCEEDIRQYLLSPELRSDVCITYVCQYSPMSTEFIEELMILSTNLFTFKNYTEDNKRFVLEMLAANNQDESVEILKGLVKEHPENELLLSLYASVFLTQQGKIMYTRLPQERIDWFNIQKHQDVEPWFKEKYGHLFNNKVSINSKTEMSYWENQ